MNIEQYRQISKALYADLDAAFAKHGLKARRYNAGIDNAAGTVRLAIQLADANMRDAEGNATTPEAERWKLYASMFDLPQEWLGRTFRQRHRKFTVCGLRDTSGKKVVAIQREDGRNFVISADGLRRALNGSHFIEGGR